MANPASFTVTSLVANDGVTRPAVQTVDTDGEVSTAALSSGDAERLFLEVINAAAQALTLTIKAGAEGAGAGRSSLGDKAIAFSATGGANPAQFVGPFEPARFVQADGKIKFAFLAASGSPNVTVRAFLMPKRA